MGVRVMAWRQGQGYSGDLRSRVLAAVDGGMAVRAVAPLFQVSVSYIYKALIRRRKTGETEASTRRGHRSRTSTTPQQAARPFIDPERLVFIDETGVNTKMVRLYGRAMQGLRLTAPMVLDGAMTGQAFAPYIRKVLAPTLSPGDILVMDNLPAHRVAAARAAIAQSRCPALPPAALFSRHEPHRDGILETEIPATPAASPNHRRPLAPHRNHP